jgi:hypothetical protein
VNAISDDHPGLFGWVPAAKRGQGRPAFAWSLEKSNKLMLLFACGYTQRTAAAVLGCDVKTLRKHFSLECREADRAELVVRSGMMARLAEQVDKGNVGAARQLDRMIHAERMRLGMAAPAERPKAVKPKGIKETEREAAWSAGAGDPEWRELIGDPAGNA